MTDPRKQSEWSAAVNQGVNKLFHQSTGSAAKISVVRTAGEREGGSARPGSTNIHHLPSGDWGKTPGRHPGQKTVQLRNGHGKQSQQGPQQAPACS